MQMLDGGESRLCAKKDVILDKFDQLLRKLGGEELSLNISLGKMGAQWHRAMEAWLDAESTYRLRIEQVPIQSESPRPERCEIHCRRVPEPYAEQKPPMRTQLTVGAD